ncbi:6-bladed beta-propeller [Fontibacter flavus]|uniref:6-bladed beta-propeller n=1 Tax=Fontibacter flavus TaxID=654838 RepID=A0ABV6FTC4_9BACT
MIYRVFFAVLFLIAISCKEVNFNNDFSLEEFRVKDEDVFLYDFSKELELIPLLYSGQESLVGIVDKLEVKDGRFFILSSTPSSQKSLLIFGQKGEFVGRIDKDSFGDLHGNSLKDFLVLEDSRILIWDNNNTILIINEDFRLIGSRQMPFRIDRVSYNKGQILCYLNKQALNFQDEEYFYDLVILDEKLNVLNRFLPFELNQGETRYHVKLSPNIHPFKNGFLFTEFLNDTVYYVDSNETRIHRIIDFGEKRFIKSNFPNAVVQPLSPILTEKFKWGIYNPLENDEFFFIGYYENDVPKNLIYEKRKNKLYKLNPIKSINEENIVPAPIQYSDEYFYGVLTEAGISFVDKEKIKSYSDKSIVKRADDYIINNGNPIIFKYKL